MSVQKRKLRLVALSNQVLFSGVITAIQADSESISDLFRLAKESNEELCIVAKKSVYGFPINLNSVYDIGSVCNIKQIIKISSVSSRVVVECLHRVSIKDVDINDSWIGTCMATNKLDRGIINQEYFGKVKGLILKGLGQFLEESRGMSNESVSPLEDISSVNELCFYISSILSISVENRQELLKESSIIKRLNMLYKYIKLELDNLAFERKMNEFISSKLAKQQKKIYLNEQLKFIRKAVGEDIDDDSDESRFIRRLKELNIPKAVYEHCMIEVKKLNRSGFGMMDGDIVKPYLECVVKLPWGKLKGSDIDIKKSKRILDRDHYGLYEIKERILEFIATYKKAKKVSGSVLCLVGSPGVGKTSLARSMALAMNRDFFKISLGGLRDESEIRGHRKTYVGAMPGKVIQIMQRTEFDDPVILLDEIDKTSYDARGDPISALLELLDSEQNKDFSDHYLGFGYNMSNVLFIATANSLNNVPLPLIDRLEIVEMSSYTRIEKHKIASKYLLPNVMKSHNLGKNELSLSDNVIDYIIKHYTREAGVRNLKRKIEMLVRKATKKIITSDVKSIHINVEDLEPYLKPPKHMLNKTKRLDTIGITNGLAYDAFGGDVLAIEAVKYSGKGDIKSTGNMGNVMKESVATAFSCMKVCADSIGLSTNNIKKYDFHVHVPEGAISKDGPSAGIALCVSLMSCASNLPVNSNIAMTGEVTLSGKILPIGGLREKLMAAVREGIPHILVPKDNISEIKYMPIDIKKHITVKGVSTINEVLSAAIIGYPDKKV